MRYPLAVALVVLLLVPATTMAAWVQDGNLVAADPQNESGQVAISDGAGGVFIAWMAPPSGAYDIYAQRLAPNGTEMWASGGVPVCTALFDQFTPMMAPDGAGGVVICWHDDRSRGGNGLDIYAQRLDANGVAQWTFNGIPICNLAGDQILPRIHFDGAAHLIAWQDDRDENGFDDIYVQRIDLNGNPQWAANGVAVVTLPTSNQSDVRVVSDGASGAILAWYDNRDAGFRVFAQSVNFFGTPVWTTNGVAVDAANSQIEPMLLEDGAGGVFIGWRDGSGTPDISVQRRDASSAELWTTNITDPLTSQYSPAMISDDAGGVIVAWSDDRDDFGDIYAQRVSGIGVPLWTQYGQLVCNAAQAQGDPELARDGAGGAVVVWDDNRFSDSDIYAQRLTAYGAPMWAFNGVPVSSAPSFQENFSMAGDGMGGAYAVWRDNRSGDRNVYAQHIEANYGAWGQPEPQIASVTDDPNDQGGDVAVNWLASERDQFLYPEVTHYSIWRAVDAVTAQAMTAATLADVTLGFDQPVVRKQTTATADYFWELVGTQDALRASGYSALAPTRADSTSVDPAVHYFQVVAHTNNSNVFYVSGEASGSSVDNLPPAAPIMLTAQRIGNYVRLDWQPGGPPEPDFVEFAVYRDTGANVMPDPLFFFDATDEITLWDQTVLPSEPYYYIVTAVDVHENQSAPSNVAEVGTTVTGVGDTPLLTSVQVRENFPNPFGGATYLRVGLPESAPVTVEVFDVAGRRVARVTDASMPAGWNSIRFDGRDELGRPLPSGVYFYRVNSGGESITRKLVIQR